MSDKIRILFVDDEQRVLHGLKRSLRTMSDRWDMTFAGSGAEALELMAAAPFDVIVSDMRMPGMNGVELLQQVREKHPRTVRLALSGQSSKESVLQSVGPIHQYLPKPFEAGALQSTLQRLTMLRNLLTNPRLQGMIAQLESLPSLPSLYRDLMAELESPDGSLQTVGAIVARDLGMSAKVLQLVNSSFFGVRRRISSPAQAVAALGFETVRALALMVCVFAPFEKRLASDVNLERIWRHGIAVGQHAMHIARLEAQPPEFVEQVRLAGLLHDIGKVVFAALLPDQYTESLHRARTDDIPINQAELFVHAATHAEVGAYLLGLWGFDDVVLNAVAYHHRPSSAPRDLAAAAAYVHAADAFANAADHAVHPVSCSVPDEHQLELLGLAGRTAMWSEAHGEPVAEPMTS